MGVHANIYFMSGDKREKTPLLSEGVDPIRRDQALRLRSFYKEEMGLSQAKYAKLVGVDTTTMNRLCSGLQDPSWPLVRQFVERSGISPLWWMLGIGSRTVEVESAVVERRAEEERRHTLQRLRETLLGSLELVALLEGPALENKAGEVG